uniref:Kinesin motor domain-containing protein n=1 Tax=Setaria digitata TaxID=48799 RepID=A0A915Q5H8_9BILA
MDLCQIGSLFRKCKCHHEVESRMNGVKENIMRAHLEVKNQLIRHLEIIIDEQEARIRNMDDYINGHIKSFSVRNKILKGISLLSLEFGTLSEENLALKEALANAQRTIRLLQLKIQDSSTVQVLQGGEKMYQLETKEQQSLSIAQVWNVNDQIELKKFANDIQRAIGDEQRLICENIGIKINYFMKSLMQRYQKEVDARKRLHNKLVELNGNIRVFCRIRPTLGNCSKSSIVIDPLDNGLIIVDNINGDRRKFNCDRAFDEKHTQSDIFDEISPIITSCMDGYNVCIFAYGHTGSGKTYTMEGPANDPGIYQRSLIHLFRIAKERLNDIDYTISVSIDLLSNNKSNLSVRIGNTGRLEIPGLLTFNVHTLQEVQEVLRKGRLNRAIATTDQNDRSSRSHAIVCVRVRAINRTTNAISESQLNLVDLAGSERVSQSGATGQQLKEAQCINRSLSELGNVVSALRQRQQHIPFRNCQLTRLLENCLNGDSKTLVVVQLVPDTKAIQETVGSLNFADKLSKVQKRNSTTKVAHDRPRLEPSFLRLMSARMKNKQMNASANKWVLALSNKSFGLNTFPTCAILADLYGDGDYKLVIGDFGTEKYNIRLKVFKGLQLIGENVLSDLPSAIVSFNNEQTQPCPASLAVACGSSILIYKNLKPFYKFTPPSLEINADEAEAWRHIEAGHIDAAQLYAVLVKLLHELGGNQLTTRSQAYLSSKEEDRETMLEQCLDSKLVRQGTITCMTTMKRSAADIAAIDCIICATEYGHIYCIDTQAFTILEKCEIPGVPVFLYAAGLFEVDYRIFVSTRDAEVFSIKRYVKSVQNPIITMEADIIGMVRVGKQLVIACTDKTITFFAANGRRQNKITLSETIQAIDTFSYEPKQYMALLVALEKEVRIYRELSLVDQQKIDQSISWIRSGRFGREEGALIIGTKDGGLIAKLFRRTATLEEKLGEVGPAQAQFRKLNLPRRTKIYVDQTIRERKHAQLMHQVFQRDLFMLRLSVTKAFANLTQNSLNSISTKKSEAVEISIEINGFGPIFRMIIKLQASSQSSLQHLYLIVHYNQELYEFEDPVIPVPALVSGMTYMFYTIIRCLNPEKGISDDVRVVLVNHYKVIVAALVTMPISEMSLLD